MATIKGIVCLLPCPYVSFIFPETFAKLNNAGYGYTDGSFNTLKIASSTRGVSIDSDCLFPSGLLPMIHVFNPSTTMQQLMHCVLDTAKREPVDPTATFLTGQPPEVWT